MEKTDDGADRTVVCVVRDDQATLSQGGQGSPACRLERMLCMAFMQHRFNLTDEAYEEALLDNTALRRLVGIDPSVNVHRARPRC